MGLFDFLKGKGGRSAEATERDVMRHAERVMDKSSTVVAAQTRTDAIHYLARIGTAEAWRALLPRYDFVVTERPIDDGSEKRLVYDYFIEADESAIEPVLDYLRTAKSVSWPIKILRALVARDLLSAD